MSSLDIIQSIYKPYRYTLNNTVTIVESSTNKLVVKKQRKDLFSLFNYLDSRGFINHPIIIRNYRNEENVFEFVEDIFLPKEQKMEELASVLASLHNKTVYYKSIDKDKYKSIYEDVKNNISYLNVVFENVFLSCVKEEFMSPSRYLYTRNYYKVRESLNFCDKELELWYEMVQDKEKVRVSVVHNNLSLDHFFYSNDKPVLISWDNYQTDIPILDFINLYRNEYLNCDFTSFLENYFNSFELLDDEKKLLFILLSLPVTFEFEENEFNNTRVVQELIQYIFQTEKLIGPYYLTNEVE